MNESINLTSKIETENYENKDENYIISFSANIHLDIIANQIIIDPFCKLTINDNPLKEEKRDYPIDMIYPESKSFTHTIKIPDGYTIKQLPETKSYNSNTFILVYLFTRNENELSISANYQFKKAIYQANEYELLKRYFNMIIDYFNQTIVLEKAE